MLSCGSNSKAWPREWQTGIRSKGQRRAAASGTGTGVPRCCVLHSALSASNCSFNSNSE